jgi:3-isopropylmalate dehydrogenase
LNRIAICGGQYFWRSEADLWTLIADEIAPDYPEVEKTHLFLGDLISLMLNTPQELDLVVADCAFGQVVADIGAVIQGGRGLAFEANLNPGKISLFMPADVACGGHQEEETANPLAAIAAIAALLDNLGLEQEAGWINGAIKYALETDNTTGDLGGRLRCEQVGDFIADQIKRGRSNKIR